MKLPGLKRIVVEDFKSDEQQLVSKIAFVVNPIIDAILQALNKNLSVTDNFNQTMIGFNVKVDSTGTPTLPLNLKYDLRSSCKGIQVINVINLSNSANIPAYLPFISFEQISANLLKIKKITGLTANQEYSITIILIPS